MHSAAGIEDRLFTPARIRLTAWYVSVLAAVLIVLGSALYLVVREQLLNGVDNGVKLVAAKATEQWVATDNVNVRSLSTGTSTWIQRRWRRPRPTPAARTCARPAPRAIASASTR
jgi:phage gp46-like protein